MYTELLELDHLSDDDRTLLQERIDEFETNWNTNRLASELRELPKDISFRFELLIGMACADLTRRWEQGQKVTVESYLKACPEFGTTATVPVALVSAEYEARTRFDSSPQDLGKMAKRFPRQVKRLREAMERTVDQPSTHDNDPDVTIDSKPSQPVSGLQPQAELPERFGRYQIIRRIGKGGMGTVYLASDSQLNRNVALKVPHFGENKDTRILDRFYREARAAAAIEHPNICPVYDVGEIDGVHYLSMGYIEGEPLLNLIRSPKGITPRQAALMTRKLALAISEAHSHGVIHRDLKPSNVMLNRRNEPVIMDFGLARSIDAEDSRLTLEGTMLGTPAYMPPEQIDGEVDTLGPGCDIYSLGVILYEMLSGRLPFEGAVTKILARVLTEDPTPLGELCPTLDRELVEICHKAMAKNPNERFRSMVSFANALAAYLKRGASGSDSSSKLSPANAPTVEKVTPPPLDPDDGNSNKQGIQLNPVPPPLPIDYKKRKSQPALDIAHASDDDDFEDGLPRRRAVSEYDIRKKTKPGRKTNWWVMGPALGAVVVAASVAIVYIVFNVGTVEPEQRDEVVPPGIPPAVNNVFANWKTYRPAFGRYSMRAPSPPIRTKRDVPDEKITFFNNVIRTDEFSFYVVYADLENDDKGRINEPLDEKATLVRMRDIFQKIYKGSKLLEEKVVFSRNRNGKEYLFESATGLSRMRMRAFLVGNRIYQAYVYGRSNLIDRPEVNYFLNMFVIEG